MKPENMDKLVISLFIGAMLGLIIAWVLTGIQGACLEAGAAGCWLP